MQDPSIKAVRQQYQLSKYSCPLFSSQGSSSQLPLTYEDSLLPVPDHPSCAIGVVTAEGKWGSKKSLTFIVEDNYLITCASNCYSDQHGEYPSITFTINSNRNSGYDTYKVSKVFIPIHYKNLPQKERKPYNYALLHIQGQSNMKDRHGSIGMKFENIQEKKLSYLDYAIDSNGQLLYSGQRKLGKDLSIPVSGGPLLIHGESNTKTAGGLIFSENGSSNSSYLLFDSAMNCQLDQWARAPKGRIDLNNIQLSVDCFKDIETVPIDTFSLYNCNLQGKASALFQNLPFSRISTLHLIYNNIGPIGCSIIASLPFKNLRLLNLCNNRIGDQGCRSILTAELPLLGKLDLANCGIGNQGVVYLSQKKRINLSEISFRKNNLEGDLSKAMENVDFPQVDYLHLESTSIKASDLKFLRSPSWKTLTKLSLNDNKIGRKGCKMIKEADLALFLLNLDSCGIDSTGAKWLCKANLTRMFQLNLIDNYVGYEGCLALSRANMPNLYNILLSSDKIKTKAMKYLLQADWAISAAEHEESIFKQLIRSFNKVEFDSWESI